MVTLEWWQGLAAVLVALGLSPAPWIIALLSNRLMTRGQHNDRVTDLKAELAAKDRQIEYEQAAKAVQADRADKAIAKTIELATEFGATTVHLLKSLPETDRDGE